MRAHNVSVRNYIIFSAIWKSMPLREQYEPYVLCVLYALALALAYVYKPWSQFQIRTHNNSATIQA